MKQILASALALLAVLGLVVPDANAGIPTNARVTVKRTASGYLKDAFKDGNDSVPVVWTTIPALSVLTTATSSLNVCTSYLTQPGSPNATITVNTGAPQTGITLGGTNGCTLSWATPTAGVATLTLKADRAGVPSISNAFTITVTAPVTSDSTPANIPTGFKITPAVNALTVDVDRPSDPVVGGQSSGVAALELRLNGTSIVSTQSISAGLQKSLPQQIFGSYTPTPTCTQSGNDYTLTSAGSLDGTSDLAVGCLTSVPGDAFQIAKVASITSTAQYPKGGMQIRSSTAANAARIVCAMLQTTGGAIYAQCQDRAVDGGTAVNIANVQVASAPYIRMTRTGNTVTADYSLNGLTWTNYLPAYTRQLPDVAYWGPVAASTEGSGGAQAIVSVQQYNLNTGNTFSFSYATTTPGTYDIRSRDAATPTANISSFSPSITATPLSEPPPSGQAVRFHPGNYVWCVPPAVNGVSGYRFDLPVHRDYYINCLETIKNEPYIAGIKVAGYPRSFEGATAGDFAASFAALDAILAKAVAVSKKVMVRYEMGLFGNYASIYDVYPNYIADGTQATGLGVSTLISLQNGVYKGKTLRPWLAATEARMTAITQAYCARYDTNPAFEEWTLIGETSISVQQGVDGYTIAGLLAAYKRMMADARAACPHTQLRLGANDMGPDSNIVDLLQTAKQYYIGIGGPDIWPGDVTQADRIFAGLNQAGQSVYENMVGKIPWTVEAQDQSFCAFAADRWPPDKLWGAYVNGYTGVDDGYTLPPLGVTHQSFLMNEYLGGPTCRWSTGTLPYLRTRLGSVLPNLAPASSVPCPTRYPACNRN